jgi:hypothetical protein
MGQKSAEQETNLALKIKIKCNYFAVWHSIECNCEVGLYGAHRDDAQGSAEKFLFLNNVGRQLTVAAWIYCAIP